MYWHLTVCGASESSGRVMPEDVCEADLDRWVQVENVSVFVTKLEPQEADPEAVVRQRARRAPFA